MLSTDYDLSILIQGGGMDVHVMLIMGNKYIRSLDEKPFGSLVNCAEPVNLVWIVMSVSTCTLIYIRCQISYPIYCIWTAH